MFRFLDSKPYISSLFIGSAKCKDQTTIDLLQKGGFVTLEAAKKGKQPIALVADPDNDSGDNVLNKKLIYPVFIARPEDTAAKHKPIAENGLINFIDDTNYTGYVNSDSYYEDGDTYATIAAGTPLKLVNNTATSNRPKLVAGDGAFATTVAYALSATDADGEIKIKWVA